MSLVVCLSGFSQKQKEALQRSAESLGFSVDPHLTSNVDVLVCASVTTKCRVARLKGFAVCTKEWLVRSPKTSPKLFPLPALAGLLVSLTGFQANERDILSRLLERHGATYSPDLTKQCTHLIVANTTSDQSKKVEYALKWKLLVVSSKWIYAIDSKNAWIDESHYGLFDSVPPISRGDQGSEESQPAESSTAEPSKSIAIKQSMLDSKFISMESSFPVLHIAATAQTQASSKENHPESQGVFCGMHFASVGFPPEKRQCLEKELAAQGASVMGEYVWKLSNPEILYIVVEFGGPIGGEKVVTDLWIEKCMEDAQLVDPESSVVYTPLNIDTPVPGAERLFFGITGYDSLDRLHICGLCEVLGAKISEKFSKQNTHLICKPLPDGSYDKSSQKYIKALEWGIKIISGEDVFAFAKTGIFSDICVAKQKPGRIEFDTRDVLSDLQDAKNSLQSPKNRRTTASRNEGKAIDSPLVASFSKNLEMAVQGCQTPRDAAAGSAGGVNRRSSARLANTFPDISTLPQTGVINVNTELPMEKSFARTESSSVERRIFGMSTQMVDDLFDSAIHEPAATETAKRPFPISPSEAKSAFKIPPPLVASGEEYSLGLVYNDPEEASAKRKLIESAQSSSKKQKPDAVIKYFMISGVSGSARSSLSQAIKKLGGVLLEGDGWDSLCTHLICAKPTKTEKCLAACASGSWMLSPSYIQDSQKENRFLRESLYEWSAALDVSAMAVGKERDCIEAGSRWRIKLENYIQDGKRLKGSFQSWIVLLVVNTKKQQGFIKVLEAGLATVHTKRLANVEYTHCFVEAKNVKEKRLEEAMGLEEANVPILDTSYISDFLQMNPIPAITLPQYRVNFTKRPKGRDR
ncbi:MAG: hypothetical protein SGCHY_003942 [Lobulomycetales sp.]